jgi:lysozyme family protein
MSAFDQALNFVLAMGGGYVKHPKDPGGTTNMGITQATYDAWRKGKKLPPQDVHLLTREEAAAIYRANYWDRIGGDELAQKDPPLALVAFDAAVQHGVQLAAQMLKASSGDWRRLLALRLDLYTNLTAWPVFGKGWTRRMAVLLRAIASFR